jgi:hypothetical protein
MRASRASSNESAPHFFSECIPMRSFLSASSLFAAFALAGCAQTGAPVDATPALPVPTPSAAVHAIRAAGAGLDSAVQVEPLRDPAIDGFLERAQAAEKAGDIAAAVEAADKALELANGAPDIQQYLAELETARGAWIKAEQHAIKSFTAGPRVGSLCARNWQTVIEARTAMNDAPTVAQARDRLKECRVAPRLRM